MTKYTDKDLKNLEFEWQPTNTWYGSPVAHDDFYENISKEEVPVTHDDYVDEITHQQEDPHSKD